MASTHLFFTSTNALMFTRGEINEMCIASYTYTQRQSQYQAFITDSLNHFLQKMIVCHPVLLRCLGCKRKGKISTRDHGFRRFFSVVLEIQPFIPTCYRVADVRRMPLKPFFGDVTWGCGYLRQICSVWVRVKSRVLSGMSIFRISSMKNDRSAPLSGKSKHPRFFRW